MLMLIAGLATGECFDSFDAAARTITQDSHYEMALEFRTGTVVPIGGTALVILPSGTSTDTADIFQVWVVAGGHNQARIITNASVTAGVMVSQVHCIQDHELGI